MRRFANPAVLRAMTGVGLTVLFGTVLLVYNDNWSRMPVWLVVVCQALIWTGLAGQLWIGLTTRRHRSPSM
jgi:hypothetical protein